MIRRAVNNKDKQVKAAKILEAAKEVFFEKGYYGTRIETIAERAGVGTGTIYLYFNSKIELYKAIQNEGLDILVSMVEETISWPGMTALAKMSAIASTYFRFYDEYREYFDIIAVLCATPAELKETETEISHVIDGKTYQLLKLIEGVVKEGVQNGEIVPIDTWKATNVYWGIMDGLILMSERHNMQNVVGVEIEELVKVAFEMTFYGIARSDRISE